MVQGKSGEVFQALRTAVLQGDDLVVADGQLVMWFGVADA